MADTQIGIRLAVSGEAQVTDAAGKAVQAIEKIGRAGQVSAAQTAAAMRTLPAQFTDIATSLAGGQSPLTVLLQQGGQIKDSFGGVGAAARAMGGYIAGLVNPFTVAAAAGGALALAYRAGASEAEAFRRELILSGNVAGVTDGQLARMSATIKDLGAGTQGRAAEILASIASSSDIGADGMVRFTAAAMRLESVGGPAAEKTAEAFKSLGRDPLAAALKLNETTNFLSVSVYEQVRALQEQGRTTEAARLAQEAYAGAIETRAPQLAASLGYVERAWNAVKSATKGAVDAALSFGRGNTLDGQIDALRARIESAQTGIYSRDKVPALQQELALLLEQQRMLQRGAEAAAARAASVRATAEWDKEGAKYASDGAKLAAEILAIRRNGLEAGKSEAQINERIADAVQRAAGNKTAGERPAARYKDAEDAARAYMAALSGLVSITQDADAKAQGLSKTQARLIEIQASPAWASFSRQQREQIISQAAASQGAEDHAAMIKQVAQVAADAARDYGKYLAEIDRGAATVRTQVQSLRDEEEAAKMAASGRMSLREAVELVTIARLRDQQVAAMGNPDAVMALQREIDARQELRGLIASQEQRRANEAAAKDAAREWERSTDQVRQSLTDALMRGGKSGAEYIKGLFRSMVLRPVISALVSPISGAISGAVGGALGLTAASATAGGLSAGATAGIAGGAGLLGGSLGLFGAGLSSGLSAWGAGGSVTGLLSSGSALFAGGAANGLGVLAGALGPIALGAAAIAALAKALDNGGTPHVGAAYTVATDGRDGAMLTSATAGGWTLGRTWSAAGNTSAAIQSTVQQFTTSLAATLGTALQAFGQQPGTVRAGFAADNSDPSIGRITIRGADGRLLSDSSARYDKSSSKGFEQFAADAGKALRDALVAADLPGWADSLLADLGSKPTVEAVQQMVQSITQLRGVFGQFGTALGLTEAEVVGLAKAFGGVDAMANSIGSYAASMYSDAERLKLSQDNLAAAFARLGQAVPANAAAYRALVEAQDLSTAAGAAMYASLVQLAPTFGEIAAAQAQAAQEQQAAAQAALEQSLAAAQAVADQRAGLERQLLELQGDTGALRQRELAALDPSNRALQERIYALTDEQAALQESLAAAQAVADERAGLERQLLELQGDTSTLRERELAALDPSNRALQQRIYALADEQQRLEDLASAGQGISEFLRDLSAPAGGGAQSLAALRDLYQADLAAAKAGDVQASQRIPGSARALLDAVRDNATTAVQVAQESSRIAAQLQALPATAAYQGRALPVSAGGATSSAAPAGAWSPDLLPGNAGGTVVDELRAMHLTIVAQRDEMQRLRDELQGLRIEGQAIAVSTHKTTRQLQEVIDRGVTVHTDADSPLATTVV